MRTNIVKVTLGRLTTVSKNQLWKEDYGQKIQFLGVDLPYSYEVDFADSPNGQAITMLGDETGVLVPDELLQKEGKIYAYLYLHTGMDDGETQYEVILPVEQRAERTDIEPTPVEQSIIEQAIVTLNNAVEKTAADVESSDANALRSEGYAVGTQDGEPVEQGSPYYRHNSLWLSQQAGQSANKAEAQASLSEAWAVGEISGHPVSSEYPQYHNNSKYYSEQAKQAKSDAQGYAQTASDKASEASGYASDAHGYSDSASSSASDAHRYASDAYGYAESAYQSYQGASGYAHDANTYAQSASGSASDASSAKDLAVQAKDDAISAKNDAVSAKEDAVSAKESAEEYASSASESASNAHDDAISASESADDAEASAQRAESATADKADIITASASGDIVTIEDGANNLPVVDLSLSLLPVQDLHGQDAPYPGGSSVNLISDGTDVNNGYIYGKSLRSDGTASDSTLYYVSEYFPVTGGATYTWSGPSTMNLVAMCWYDSSKAYISGVAAEQALPKTLTAPANAAYCRSSQYIDTSNIVQLESGSSATTPRVPYSNICQINGWTGIDLYRTGENLFDVATEIKKGTSSNYNLNVGSTLSVGTNSAVTISGTNPIEITNTTNWRGVVLFSKPLKKGMVVRVRYRITGDSTSNIKRARYLVDDNNNIVSVLAADASVNQTVDYVYIHDVTITQDGLRLAVDIESGSSKQTITLYDYAVTYPKKTKYEPYVGQTYPISWQSEAGTVYGGSLDVTSGVLTVNTGSIVVDGTLINQVATASTGVQAARIAFTFPTGMGLVACDTYPIVTQVPQSGSIGARQVSSTVYIYNDAFTDLATAQALLSANNVTIIYRLATPIEYQLSETQIKTLLGTNNIWSNANGKLDLEYRCDTKLYIEQLTKPTEDDMTANQNIQSGKFFMIGNRLFLSSVAIGQGETIVPGTNCTEVSLADALNTINS